MAWYHTLACDIERSRLMRPFDADLVSHCLLNNTNDAILGIDGSGAIRSWNHSATTIYGYVETEILGAPIDMMFGTDNEQNDGVLAKDMLKAGAPVRGWETRQLRKDGSTVHVSLDMWPLVTDEGVVVGMCIAARETGKYKMLQSQLRQTQKLEAVGRLSGGIAHDFNNLLTVISGYNDMIRAELPVNSPTWEWAVEVSKAAEQATSLTNQLLAFSRREVTQPRVLCLNDMVTDLDKMLQRIVGEDIRIVISLQPKLENIKADPGQVSQMLTNLVINARDAMPQGGTVTIATDSVYFNPTVAAEPDMAPGLYIRLRVSDSGCGMDRETQQHLFEPFFTTKPRGKGTGLGLSIVYGIVSQLRGQISVASEIGVGTAFAICLPATTEQPIARRVAPAETPRPMSPDITILLVEDDGGVRHLARHMLLKFGYTVYETGDPLEAIRICSAIHIDVLLTDIVMPVMSGPDLAVTLLTSNEHLKVVYMSGHIDDSILPQSCMDPGINFIRKPFTATRLNEQIMDVRKQGCQLPSTTGSLTT